MGMGICDGCGQIRHLSRAGYCVQCMRVDQEKADRSKPDHLREHPDLAEFDDFAEDWYAER